jgi:uncharacterized protein (TIGR02300 family)
MRVGFLPALYRRTLPVPRRRTISGRQKHRAALRFGFDRPRRLWQWRVGDARAGRTSTGPTTTPGTLVEEQALAKPEWGTKRICPSCGTRYYDLMREPIICPKCSTPFDPEAFLRARRSRPALVAERELEPIGTEEIDADLETEEIEETEEEEAVALEEGEEEDEELIEDASELGEDQDDMAEVIDNVEEEEN